MTLYLIGLGLGTMRQITIEALEAADKLDKLYLDAYTSFIDDSFLSELLKKFGEKLIIADRGMLEEGASEIILEAKYRDVGILVPGDPLIATTHISIVTDAAKNGVNFKLVHGLSIYCAAISSSGLHSYKFGKTATIPKSGFGIETCYRVIADNMERGLHTLILLDTADGGLRIPEAIKLLWGAEERLGLGVIQDDRLVLCLARIGFGDEFVWAGTLRDAAQKRYPPPPHSMIFPGELHFSEIKALREIFGADPDILNRHRPPRLWRSRIRKYVEKVERVLSEIKYLSEDAAVRDLIDMAKSYLEDSERFLEMGDLFNSLAAISYAEGILDALKLTGKVEFNWDSGERVNNKS